MPRVPENKEDEARLIRVEDLTFRAVYRFNRRANLALQQHLDCRYTSSFCAGWEVLEEDLYDAKDILERFFRCVRIEDECPGLGDTGT